MRKDSLSIAILFIMGLVLMIRLKGKLTKAFGAQIKESLNNMNNKNTLDKSFVEFIIEQIQDAGNISYKYMFGGCVIYCGSKVVALICNNRLYIKPTKRGKEFIKIVSEEPPYQGAKPHFLIEDNIDNKEWLCDLIKITAEELPQPKRSELKKVALKKSRSDGKIK